MIILIMHDMIGDDLIQCSSIVILFFFNIDKFAFQRERIDRDKLLYDIMLSTCIIVYFRIIYIEYLLFKENKFISRFKNDVV